MNKLLYICWLSGGICVSMSQLTNSCVFTVRVLNDLTRRSKRSWYV